MKAIISDFITQFQKLTLKSVHKLRHLFCFIFVLGAYVARTAVIMKPGGNRATDVQLGPPVY
jgi:hypothetical protein